MVNILIYYESCSSLLSDYIYYILTGPWFLQYIHIWRNFLFRPFLNVSKPVFYQVPSLLLCFPSSLRLLISLLRVRSFYWIHLSWHILRVFNIFLDNYLIKVFTFKVFTPVKSLDILLLGAFMMVMLTIIRTLALPTLSKHRFDPLRLLLVLFLQGLHYFTLNLCWNMLRKPINVPCEWS